MYLSVGFLLSVLAYGVIGDEDKCYDLKQIHEELQPIHDKCKALTKEKSHGDKQECYTTYRICHLKNFNVLNEAGDGVDHEKFIEFMKSKAAEGKKNAVDKDLHACKEEVGLDNDKIEAYFSCFEEKLANDCPEMKEYRAQFKQEFEGSSEGIC